MTDRWHTRLRLALALGLLLLGSVTAPRPVAAASAPSPAAPIFTVNSVVDVVAAAPLSNGVCETGAGNHTCTLRAALMKANHYPGGGVTIHLPAGTYSLSSMPTGADGEADGDLNITNTVTLLGAGAATTIIDAEQIDRVLSVGLGVTVTLANVTLRNGYKLDVGAGLRNRGLLTLNAVVLSGNQTAPGSSGGGIVNLSGALTLNNTIVRDNLAHGNGGGVFNNNNALMTLNSSVVSNNQTADGGYGGGISNAGTLMLNNSLVSGNQTTRGGGLATDGKGGGIANFSPGTLTLFNSTVSNNSALSDGGGIYNEDTLNATFATLAGNLADNLATASGTGGGIYNISTLNLKTSLLGQNFAGANPSDGFGAVHSLDYNWIQTASGLTVTGQTAHNVIGHNPLIDSPADNGGPTLTRALLAGSLAVDVIPTNQCTDLLGAPLTRDQRGFPRPINGLCDIGAFEGQPFSLGYRRNLVYNGDAEAAAGSPAGVFVAVPFWQTSGQLLAVAPYNAAGGFPTVGTDLVPANHGDNLFAGGFSAVSGGHQLVNLSAFATSIDDGGVSYVFSADLGGIAGQADNATVEADFYDDEFNLVGQLILGPVTDADRGGRTGLLPRATTGTLPLHTRTVMIFVTLTRSNGSYNDGYADNVSLLLLPRATLFLPLLTR